MKKYKTLEDAERRVGSCKEYIVQRFSILELEEIKNEPENAKCIDFLENRKRYSKEDSKTLTDKKFSKDKV